MSFLHSLDRRNLWQALGVPLVATPIVIAEPEASRAADGGRELLDDALSAVGGRREFRENRLPAGRRNEALRALIRPARHALRSVTQALDEDAITLPGWHRAFRATLLPLQWAAGMLGSGTDEPPPADQAAIVRRAGFQLAYLDGFRQALLTGAQRLGPGAIARAALYASAAWAAEETVRRAKARRDGFTEERRILGESQHCPECPGLAAVGWQPIGSLPEIGETVCMASCACWFEYR